MSVLHRMQSVGRGALCAVLVSCALVQASPVFAQAVGAPAPGPGMAAPPQSTGSGAPVQAGLPAPMPADRMETPAAEHAQEPAAERSMAFSAGGSECRDTVPGGTLLAVAYAIVLLVIGGYVALLARKNATLSAALLDLEAEIGRRSPARKRDDSDDPK